MSYVHGVTKSQTRLKQLSIHMHILCCGAEEGLFLHWRMFRNIHVLYLDFPGGSDGKDSACSVGDLGSIRSLGWEDSLEEGMVTHASILA